MNKWNYLKVPIYYDYELDSLDQYGDDGWELVQIIAAASLAAPGPIAVAIFKRPVLVELVELEGMAEGFAFAHPK